MHGFAARKCYSSSPKRVIGRGNKYFVAIVQQGAQHQVDDGEDEQGATAVPVGPSRRSATTPFTRWKKNSIAPN